MAEPFHDEVSDLHADAGPVLCGLARAAIAQRLGMQADQFGTLVGPDGPSTGPATRPACENWLDEPGAAFVTLTQAGALRGCIGSLEAYRPLRADVEANAVNAAVRDPRFPPLAASELGATRIEVSVLNAPEPYPFTNRADALARLRPGVDGLTLEYGRRRGTFLPQVWQQLPTPEEFLAHLVRKAGLPDGWWDNDARLSRYTVMAFEEP